MALSTTTFYRGQNLINKLYPKIQQRLTLLPRPNYKKKCDFNTVSLQSKDVITSFKPPSISNLDIFSNLDKIQTFGTHVQYNVTELWNQISTWFIKRTFQPSIIRKRRKTGFLTRQKSVGGRRVLARRKLKGRMRLGGS